MIGSPQRLLGRISQVRPQVALDLLFLIGSGLIILYFVGLLQSDNPMGDDTLFRIANIRDLAYTFPNFQWDPHPFNGYSSAIGFPWTAYSPPALLVALGGDPFFVFYFTFLTYFFLLGFAVYYFARKIEGNRVVALALPILVWSTNTYWNYSIWGGAYARTFSLPFMFAALALTYEYAVWLNKGEGSPKKYFLVLALWFLTFLGDVYIAVIGVGIASWFVLLSPGRKNLRSGVARLAIIFLPVLALTAWFSIPLIEHVLTVGPLRNDVTPNQFSQLFLVAPMFIASLNPVYIPSIGAISILATARRYREVPKNYISSAQGAMIISLSIMSIYYFIMGWIPLLWPFLPRLMATYDSNGALSLMFVMLLSTQFGALGRTTSVRLTKRIALLFLLVVLVNASIVIPGVRPGDSNPLTNDLRHLLNENVSLSNDYRVSLDGRVLTRWFPYYDPSGLQTGGRLDSLNLNPLYQSWYQTEVYYKADLSSLNLVYLDDQPVRNVSQYIGTAGNLAETRYWLDWYGSSAIVLPAFPPVGNTARTYSDRSAVFSTSMASTSYGVFAFVRYNAPDPILSSTNSPTVGFYSEQQDSVSEYNYLLALFSYLGLSSKYVITISLSSIDNVPQGLLDLVVTDAATYSRRIDAFNALSSQGIGVLVTSSGQGAGPPGSPTGRNGLVIQMPESLSRLSQLGIAGAYDLFQQIPSLFQLNHVNSTGYSFYPLKNISLIPQKWTPGYARNAVGSLATGANNFTVTLSIPDPGSSAEFNIDYSLASPVLLSPELNTYFSVQANANSVIGMVYNSANFTSNYVWQNEGAPGGQWVNFRAPFSDITNWFDQTSKFAMADKFTLGVNIPPGHSSATIQFRNVSMTVPSFAVFSLANPVPLSADGFLQNLPTTGSSSIILSDLIGSLAGSYETQNAQTSLPVVPLADFTSEANHSFSRIILVGQQSNQLVSVGTLQRPAWLLAPSNWATNQNLNIPDVPSGFRGLVWKETYTRNWKVLATDKNGRQSFLEYYQAGPGLVYVPLNRLFLNSLSITYVAYNFGELLIFAALASSLVPVIVFRRRICGMGANKKIRFQNSANHHRVPGRAIDDS